MLAKSASDETALSYRAYRERHTLYNHFDMRMITTMLYLLTVVLGSIVVLRRSPLEFTLLSHAERTPD